MSFRISATFLGLAASLAGAGVSSVAHAGIFEERCQADALDPTEAALRLEWARRCGTTVNIISPANPDPNRRFPTGGTSSNGVLLWEYSENDEFFGRNSYSGNNGGYINTVFTQYQFKPFPNTLNADPDVNGFQRWTKPALLPRPLYPTFSSSSSITATNGLFPHPQYLQGIFSDCRLFTDRAGLVPASPQTFYVSGFCTSSCYTPEQTIAFTGGSEKIIDAITAVRPSGLTTVAPGSTLDKLQFQSDDVGSYTRELRDASHVIYELRTASGGALRLTDKHPVIEGSGRIVEASSLKAGDTLIKADGSRDALVSVTKTSYFGKVYNIKPRSTDRTANILIAQGYLVGSSRYQNEDVDYINRIIFSRGIPADVIPQ